ncbi:LOG family protein [Patescibacteria group bacterium]|nr:LOG family protein [bacterium]MBU1901944.1 LOG family protein [Patescibacteria group bacterium]
MFGSARAMSPEDLAEEIKKAWASLESASDAEAAAIRQKVTICEQMSRYYADATRLSYLLTKHFQGIPDARNLYVVCSGGGPGIMEAANRGAHEAGGKTVGFGISLPFEQGINRFIDRDLAFEFHYFFMRKYWFMYMAKALVVFPGGYGTMDEFFEVLTLVQTRKVTKKLPIILYGSSYWEDIIRLDNMVKWGVISPEDVDLFKICDTPEVAFEYLRREINHNDPSEPEPPVAE